MVRKILRQLEDEGICKLYKLPTDLRLTAKGIVHGEAMPSDFMGHNMDGRCVYVECKDVGRSTLPIGKSPGLKPFQMAAAIRAERMGAIYWLFWKLGGQFIRALPASFAGYKSIPWSGGLARDLDELPRILRASIMSRCNTDVQDSSLSEPCFSSPATPLSTP